MALLVLQVSGDAELQAKLVLVQQALNVEEIADEGAALLLGRIRARFLAQTDPDGKPWVPSFAARMRAARGYGGGTLFDTGRLFHSIQVFASGPGAREIGTNVPYAAKHNFGIGQIRRQFLGFTDEDIDMVTESIKRRVQQAVRGV